MIESANHTRHPSALYSSLVARQPCGTRHSSALPDCGARRSTYLIWKTFRQLVAIAVVLLSSIIVTLFTVFRRASTCCRLYSPPLRGMTEVASTCGLLRQLRSNQFTIRAGGGRHVHASLIAQWLARGARHRRRWIQAPAGQIPVDVFRCGMSLMSPPCCCLPSTLLKFRSLVFNF
jgi:hypothetical protein